MNLTASLNRSKNIRKVINDLGHSGRTDKEKIAHILKEYYANLAPKEKIDFDDYMDKYIYLATDSSAEAGLFRTARFPFLRKIMKKLSLGSYAKTISWMKGSQVAATTVLTGWFFYLAENDPSPLMILQPVEKTLEKWKLTKLKPMANASPTVKPVFGDDIPHAMQNNISGIGYKGGSLNFATSKSANSVASTSVKHLGVDEADRCEKDVAGEGDSIALADRRTSNFDGKRFYNSTPNLKDTSYIEPAFEAGTKERFLLPCPHCNEKAEHSGVMFDLLLDDLKFTEHDASTVLCMCPSCGCLINEHYKTWMLENGLWWRFNPTAKKEFLKDETRNLLLIKAEKHRYHSLTPEDKNYILDSSIDDEHEVNPSFHISALYSPLGFYSWIDVITDFLKATDSKDKLVLKTFYNTILGLTWNDNIEIIDHKHLAARKELFSIDGSFDIPANGVVVTGGVDVQKDRLELMVLASGEFAEEFIIDYKVFYGNTKIVGDNNLKFNNTTTCWGQLYSYLFHEYTHESGEKLGIDCTLIDSRYNSPEVFRFCKLARSKNVYPVHGKEGWGNGILKRPLKPNNYGVKNFTAYTDETKVKLYGNLKNENHGMNSIRFSNNFEYPENFFQGLTIEVLKTKMFKGQTIKYWYNPPHGRNEPIDTYCYAATAVAVLRPSFSARYNKLYKVKTKKVFKKRVRSKGIT